MSKVGKIVLQFILFSLTAIIIVGCLLLAVRDQVMVDVDTVYTINGGTFDIEQPASLSFAKGTEYVVRAPYTMTIQENYANGMATLEHGEKIMTVDQAITLDDFEHQESSALLQRDMEILAAQNQFEKYKKNLEVEQAILASLLEERNDAHALYAINGMSEVNYQKTLDAYTNQQRQVADLQRIIESESQNVTAILSKYEEADKLKAMADEVFSFTEDNISYPTDDEGTFLANTKMVITYSNPQFIVKKGEVLFKYVDNSFTDDVLLSVDGPIPAISEGAIWQLYPEDYDKFLFFEFNEDVFDHGKRYLKGKLLIPAGLSKYKDIKVMENSWGNFTNAVKKSQSALSNMVLKPKVSTYETAFATLPKSCFTSINGIKAGNNAKIFVISKETTAFGEENILREIKVTITNVSNQHVGFTLAPNQRYNYMFSYRGQTQILAVPSHEHFDGLAVKVEDVSYD